MDQEFEEGCEKEKDKTCLTESPAGGPSHYVGIGASAGGLEALDLLFKHLPSDSGLAFIVIQHLSPDYKSLMVELLSKRTSMAVKRAEEGMGVEPNTVYLIPPKKQLTIFHGRLLLSDTDPGRGINLPIDVFFRSLAADQADKSVGIILSGTGSDGVRGIRSIKEAGGFIMVQSEETAKFNGMPRAAIATGLADVITSPEEIPERLLSFIRSPGLDHAQRPQALLSDEEGLSRIFAILREHAKVDFTFYKPNTVLRRIERRIAVNQARDLREYLRILETRPGEVSVLFRELLIGVTNFFRDREVFDELGKTFLPELIENTDQQELRFWVAGCSTGEEAYSLAILARECLDRTGRMLNLKIFATDIDREALFHAGNGIYAESIAADLPAGILSKYFVRRDDHYQIQRHIREMVVFAQHNIVKDPPFTNVALLSCRNLLIYFQTVLQHRVMELFNFSLKPGGILLLGTSETPGEMGDYFESLHNKFKIYRSRGQKKPPSEPQFHAADVISQRRQVRFDRSALISSHLEEERLIDRLLQCLAEEFVPLVAAVNERSELLHLVGNPEGYLRLPSGKLSSDITRMALKELAIPLSTGLQKVFQTGADIKYTNIHLPSKDASKLVQMRIKLLPGRKGQEKLAGVFLQDMPLQRRETSQGPSQEYDISREAEQRIQDLEQELQFTKENLQATIEELETSNEELQATNEELLASNEELQSTNEELQSVNEELHTVNTEYQSKIVELTEITNDLENLMAATRIGTMFLDENMDIRKFTPEVGRVFRVRSSDIGRPMTHLTHRIEDFDVNAALNSVLQQGTPRETEVRTTDGSWFLMRALPYQVGGGTASGIVLTFTDIGPLKRAEQEIRMNEARLRSLVAILQKRSENVQELLDFALDEAVKLTSSQLGYIYQYYEDGKEFVLNTWSKEVMHECSIKDPQTCYELDKTGLWGEAVRQGKPLVINDFQAAHPLKRGYPPGHAHLYKFMTIPVYSGSRIIAVVGVANKMDDYRETDVLQLTLLMDSVFKVVERIEAEEALRCTDLLNSSCLPSRMGSWVLDVELQKMHWTDEMYRLHGVSPGASEYVERYLGCYSEPDRKSLLAGFQQSCETGRPFNLELPFTDFQGRAKRVILMGQAVMEQGKAFRIVGAMLDITPA